MKISKNPLTKQDITGFKINHWNVIQDDYNSDNTRHRKCLCLCDCQIDLPEHEREYDIVDRHNIINDKTYSCGKCKSRSIRNGDVFGKWTVKNRCGSESRCECECECGTIKMVRKHSLLNGNSKSCHQCKNGKISIGDRFGRLTVVSEFKELDKKGINSTMFGCHCDCENELPYDKRRIINVKMFLLKNGSVRSCGCLLAETRSISGRKNKTYNRYDLKSEGYGIGYTDKGEIFKFDKKQYDNIKKYKWRYEYAKHTNYVTTTINKKNENTGEWYADFIKMHMLIMGRSEKKDRQDGYVVDHINGDGTDNRLSNLRLATYSQNGFNKKRETKTLSGVVGVTFDNKVGKWRVRIQTGGESHHIGYYTNKEDAIRAREKAEVKYFGEYRRK